MQFPSACGVQQSVCPHRRGRYRSPETRPGSRRRGRRDSQVCTSSARGTRTRTSPSIDPFARPTQRRRWCPSNELIVVACWDTSPHTTGSADPAGSSLGSLVLCDGDERNPTWEDLVVNERLLIRAAQGDEEAFRDLTNPHRRELQVHCYRILGSMQDAEDVLQETLLAAWRGLEQFEQRASLRAWLYRIATNRSLNALRDAGRRPPTALEFPFDTPEPTRFGEPTRVEPYPDFLLDGIIDASAGPDARYETRRQLNSPSSQRFNTFHRDSVLRSCFATCSASKPPRSRTWSTAAWTRSRPHSSAPERRSNN